MMIFNDAWTGADKNKHFSGCLVLAFVLSFAGYIPAVLIVGAIALGKEVIWDGALGKGTNSFQDLIVSLAGMVAGMGLHYGFVRII